MLCLYMCRVCGVYGVNDRVCECVWGVYVCGVCVTEALWVCGVCVRVGCVYMCRVCGVCVRMGHVYM